MIRYISILAVAFFMFSCSTLHKSVITSDKAQTAEVRTAIDSANKVWEKAMFTKDAAAVAGLFSSSGAMLTASGKVYQGKEAVEELMNKNFNALGPVIASLKTDNLWMEGKMAYETGKWQYTFIPTVSKSHKKQKISGRYLVIWQKQGGTWKIMKDFGLND